MEIDVNALPQPTLLVEHNTVPGTVYSNRLLIEGAAGCLLNECEINEATDSVGRKLTTFKGKFQEAEAVNKNKRMYPRTVLEVNVKKLNESLGARGLIGELDHPTDSIVHFKDCSHVVTKLWWENNVLMGEGQILNTPCGKLLKSLIDDDIRVGISSRGVGNGKVNEDGILVIGESYRLITFDAVADPSTHAAFQQKVVGGKNESEIPQFTNNNTPKNESTSIHMNKDALVAVLGGIIKSKANELLKRG